MIDKVFCAGGIGTGILFMLEGEHTMTRNESRLGRLTDYRDYCKAHIISHYIAKLARGARVYAIGMVGADEPGERLVAEMSAAGINTRFVMAAGEARTMMSVCYQYPDGSGGNITSSNSACALVSPAYVERCAAESDMDENSLVVAAPEIPLESRIRLLEIGRAKNAFTVSSFIAGEAREFEKAGGFLLSQMIAINMDEAAAAGGGIESAANKISGINPEIKIIITAGAGGSYIYEDGLLTHIACIPEDAVNTAGAGDAYLGGAAAAIISGMNFRKAAGYGAVIARFAVLSRNAIAGGVTLENVESYIREKNIPI